MEIDYFKVCARRSYNNSISHYIKIIIYVLFYKAIVVHEKYNKEDDCLCVYSVDTIGPNHLETLRHNIFKNKKNIIYIKQKFSILHFFGISFDFCKLHKVRDLTDFFALKYRRDHAIFLKEIDCENYANLVTICDNTPYENLISQIFNSLGKMTYTCQHGLYAYYDADLNPNRTLYESLVSKRLLSWGKATEIELSQYDKASFEFISVGNQTINQDELALLKELQINVKNNFGVILNGQAQKDFNYQLIEHAKQLAKKCNLKYVIRLHPKNIRKDYIKYIDENCLVIDYFNNKDYFKLTDFSIAHSTGLFALCLLIGHKVYLFDNMLSNQFKIDQLTYKSIDDLIVNLNNKFSIELISNHFNGIYKDVGGDFLYHQ